MGTMRQLSKLKPGFSVTNFDISPMAGKYCSIAYAKIRILY